MASRSLSAIAELHVYIYMGAASQCFDSERAWVSQWVITTESCDERQ